MPTSLHSSKNLRRGLPDEENEEERGRNPAILRHRHHEPIIDPGLWDRVQNELRQRSGRYVSRTHPLTKMIYCADCTGTFGRKTWHSGTKYERRIWRCNNKYARGKTPCATPHVTDTDVEQAFVEALAERVKSNTGARNALEILEVTVFDTSELEAQRDRAAQRLRKSQS
ncbi:zinc ribbon domain-containing protein [Arcanobacterium canis]